MWVIGFLFINKGGIGGLHVNKGDKTRVARVST